jgi:hypothetical protein
VSPAVPMALKQSDENGKWTIDSNMLC